MKRLSILALLVICLFGCSTGPGPKEVLSKFIDASWKGRYEEAYSLLSSKDKAMKSLDAFSKDQGSDNPFKAVLADKASFKVKDMKTEGDKASSTVEITMPDLRPLFGELFGVAMTAAFGGQKDNKAIEKTLKEKIQGKDFPTTTETKTYDLIKEKDGWRVFLNIEGIAKAGELQKKAVSLEKQKKFAEAKFSLEEASKLNPRDTGIPDKIKGLEKTAAEYKVRQEYFDKIEVRGVHVGQTVFDQPGVFGEVKNRGDKTLKEVEITVYCLDSAGSVVHEKNFYPVLVSEYSFGDNRPLKPNYGKTFGYRIEGAPSDWAKKVRVAVTDVKFE
jgi:hypothetical protein